MHGPTQEADLVTEETTQNFGYWLGRPFISEALRKELSKTNLLIVPAEGFRDRKEPVFPVGTEELFDSIKRGAPEGLKPEICIEDKDYMELALHSDLLIVASFVVTSIFAPIAVNLIWEFIKRRLGPGKDHSTVKCEITVVGEDGSAKKLSYEGPATTFEKIVGARLQPPKPEVDKN